MKKYWNQIRSFALVAVLALPVVALAQNEEKEREVKEKKDVEQVIITRKGSKNDKVVVEINGDKITVNGKPLEEFDDEKGDLIVKKGRYKNDYDALFNLARVPKNTWTVDNGEFFKRFTLDSNRALLGVNTEKSEKGVKVVEVTKESAAEKSGLKAGDIITKVNDTKIEETDGLSKAIRSHKPGDKVTITYLRDNKEQKVTAELKRYQGAYAFNYTPGSEFKFHMDDVAPRIREMQEFKAPYSLNWNWNGSSSKLGLSVQDTDDGKGVKVIGVDDDSNAAKAGLKEDDVITEVDGKAINSTDEMVRIIKESKTKASVMVKLQRAGKVQNIEVKMPRKIKSADL